MVNWRESLLPRVKLATASNRSFLSSRTCNGFESSNSIDENRSFLSSQICNGFKSSHLIMIHASHGQTTDTMSVANLSVAQCHSAVHQTIANSNFRTSNPHLSATEVAALQHTPPAWPATKPVFSPFASTHDGYSQIRVSGTKYFIHRITFKSYYNYIESGKDISHTLYLGSMTTR